MPRKRSPRTNSSKPVTPPRSQSVRQQPSGTASQWRPVGTCTGGLAGIAVRLEAAPPGVRDPPCDRCLKMGRRGAAKPAGNAPGVLRCGSAVETAAEARPRASARAAPHSRLRAAGRGRAPRRDLRPAWPQVAGHHPPISQPHRSTRTSRDSPPTHWLEAVEGRCAMKLAYMHAPVSSSEIRRPTPGAMGHGDQSLLGFMPAAVDASARFPRKGGVVPPPARSRLVGGAGAVGPCWLGRRGRGSWVVGRTVRLHGVSVFGVVA